MTRCPGCGNFLMWAFHDDVQWRPVYQCRTVGVDVYDNGKRAGQTLDHSDRFYVVDGIGLQRVVPMKIGDGWTVRAAHGATERAA